MMDELFQFHCSSIPSCPTLDNNNNYTFLGDADHHHQYMYASEIHDHQGLIMERSDLIKAQIANHPLYPTLLSSYIDCTKVGAPPEMASVFEEIGKENYPICVGVATEIGKNPELDHFMRSYCDALQKYKEELSKPFVEATNFLSSIGSQLTALCNQTLPSNSTYSNSADAEMGEVVVDERVESGDILINEGVKEMVMRKYRGFVSSLRKEMLNKRKKSKLPNNAIAALFDWWNTHYRWPYPTDEDKNMLSEITGLDLKQINNWFINQRKRHWRPSQDMRFALMEGVSVAVVDNDDASSVVYFDSTPLHRST